MSRKNTPNKGSLKKVRDRWYYNVKLPGSDKRKSYALVQPGHTKSTKEKRLAITLANDLWNRAELAAAADDPDVEYNGTIPSLKELFLEAHKKEIADKPDEVGKKEIRFYISAINDLIDFLESVPFSLVTFDLKPNRLLLWRKYLHTDKGICRNTINKKINVIKQMVQYAAMRELEPADLSYNLNSIKPIKKNQENFKDYALIVPVDWKAVEKIFPYLDDMVCDMLTVIHYTGARPGEIRIMRPCDIDKSDPQAWIYRPSRHKTQRHGQDRTIIIGANAQAVLHKYLVRPGQLYCFPPQKSNSQINHGPCYTSGSFAKIISRAVKMYNDENPDSKIKFHANQLRHAFATQVCREHGLEVTRCTLGHTTTQMTKRYARQALEAAQIENAKRAVKKIG